MHISSYNKNEGNANQINKYLKPEIDEMYDIFEKYIKDNNQIIGIFISSYMSKTYTTARLAKEIILDKYPNAVIQLIDSKSNCMHLGLAVIAGAKAVMEGKALEEVTQKIEYTLRNSYLICTPSKLEYIKKLVVKNINSIFAKIFSKTRYVFMLDEGRPKLINIVKNKEEALKLMEDKLIKYSNNNNIGEIIVNHAGCKEEAKKFANSIEKKTGKQVKIYEVGIIMHKHIGRGSIILIYSKLKVLS